MILLVFGAHASPATFDAPRSLQLYDLWARVEAGESEGAAAALGHGLSWNSASTVEASVGWRGAEQWRFSESAPAFREAVDVVVASRTPSRPGLALALDGGDAGLNSEAWGTAAVLARLRWAGEGRALELRAGGVAGVDVAGPSGGGRVSVDAFANITPRVALGGSLRSDLWLSEAPLSDSSLAIGVRAWPTPRWEPELFVGANLSADGSGSIPSAWSEAGLTWWMLDNLGIRASAGGSVDSDAALTGWAFGGVSVRWSKASSRAPARPSSHVFRVVEPGASSVALLGSFTSWMPVPMVRGEDGTWTAEMALPPGPSEYVYLVDGVVTVPTDAERLVPDGFGGHSGVVEGPGGV
ncbi:hypothetical protein LBMAG42_28940 [Deltaproteobacteria bacterium]|nr:hypothetical protein LBMAG42_28940 [Deltaproteobacteria bacterium]